MLIYWGGFWPIILQPYFRVVNTNLIKIFPSMVEIPESQNACLSKQTLLRKHSVLYVYHLVTNAVIVTVPFNLTGVRLLFSKMCIPSSCINLKKTSNQDASKDVYTIDHSHFEDYFSRPEVIMISFYLVCRSDPSFVSLPFLSL